MRRTDPRPARGRFGESVAGRYLVHRGVRVVDRNVRFRFGELDLVGVQGETVVFVEVKCRSSTAFGTPAEAVTARKRARLVRAGAAYLARRGWSERACRFDVVEVVGARESSYRVRWIRDAFRA